MLLANIVTSFLKLTFESIVRGSICFGKQNQWHDLITFDIPVVTGIETNGQAYVVVVI